MSDVGGDPACWARVTADEVTTSFAAVPDAAGSGAVWSLPHGGGLDANVVRLVAGDAVGEHVNDEVDVLLVVWSGTGELVIDDHRVPLGPGTITHVCRGARRSVRAAGDGLVYLSVHPRRGPMVVGRPDEP